MFYTVVVRVGIVGCGWVTNFLHMPAYRRLPAVEVSAISDTLPANLEFTSNRWAIKKAYNDYNRMFDEETLDIVCVNVPPSQHARVSIAAANHGYHVFCEKPMASSMSEVEQMIKASAKNDVKLMVDENYRWLPEIRLAKEYLEKGMIGAPFFIRFEDFAWKVESTYRARSEKLLMIEMGSHYADLVRWFAGSKATWVHAVALRILNQTTAGENFYSMAVEFENGLVGRIDGSWCSKASHYQMKGRIDGTSGTILIDWDSRPSVDAYAETETRGWMRTKEFKRATYEKVVGENNHLEGREPGSGLDIAYVRHGVECAMEELVTSIRERREPLTNGLDNMETMKIIFAAYESAERKQTIRIA